jgi:hypothetical protein
MNPIPFQLVPWNSIARVEHAGEQGMALWRCWEKGGLRIRMVEYTAGYVADHWCTKGHIVHCLQGSFISELKDGITFELQAGSTYVVSDEMSIHRSISPDGVTLLIIDGDFLKNEK